MPAPSLFCEHKKLRSTCALCGSSRVGPPPAKGPSKHDPDATWHALRLECHARFRGMMKGAKGKPWSAELYWAAYDKPGRVAPRHSEEEDPSTFRGAYYLAMVKLFDISVEGRRIQGYNSLSDWDDMRDYVFRRISADELPKQIAAGTLQIQGGNAAWPRQQIASDLVRSPKLREIVELVGFGAESASDAEIAKRLTKLLEIAKQENAEAGALSLGSKILHAFAPERWPAHWTRSVPDVGEELGVALPDVKSPSDYLAFAKAVRAWKPDLVAADIAFNNAYEELNATGDDDEELPPLDE